MIRPRKQRSKLEGKQKVSITPGRAPDSTATIALFRFLPRPCRNGISLSSVKVGTVGSFAPELHELHTLDDGSISQVGLKTNKYLLYSVCENPGSTRRFGRNRRHCERVVLQVLPKTEPCWSRSLEMTWHSFRRIFSTCGTSLTLSW